MVSLLETSLDLSAIHDRESFLRPLQYFDLKSRFDVRNLHRHPRDKVEDRFRDVRFRFDSLKNRFFGRTVSIYESIICCSIFLRIDSLPPKSVGCTLDRISSSTLYPRIGEPILFLPSGFLPLLAVTTILIEEESMSS